MDAKRPESQVFYIAKLYIGCLLILLLKMYCIFHKTFRIKYLTKPLLKKWKHEYSYDKIYFEIFEYFYI